MNHFHCKTIATSLAVLILGALNASSAIGQQAHVTAIESIPANSTAFLHADLQGLTNSKGLEFFKALAREIKPELDELSMEQCGIPASKFKATAMIIPPVDAATFGQMAQGNAKDFLGVVTFTESIDPTKMIGTLDGKWVRFNAKGRNIYVCEARKMNIYHYADNAICLLYTSPSPRD